MGRSLCYSSILEILIFALYTVIVDNGATFNFFHLEAAECGSGNAIGER